MEVMSCRCVGSNLRDHTHQRLPEEREEKSRIQGQTQKQNPPNTPKGTKENKKLDSHTHTEPEVRVPTCGS